MLPADRDRRNAMLGTCAFMLAHGLFAAPALSQARKSLRPVRIASAQGNLIFTMQELVKAQGYLNEFGIDPEILTVSDGSKLIGALTSGSSDICVLAGFSQTLVAIEKGARMKIIACASVGGQLGMVSAKPKIKSVHDLNGKVIGVGAVGALLHQVTVALLKKNGIDIASVRFVNIGSSADVFRAVVAGTVDAGPVQADVFNQLEKYKLHLVEGGAFWRDLPEYTWQASFAMDRVIAEHRDLLVRVLAAYGKAYRFAQADPTSKEAFIQARWKSLGGASFETVAEEAAAQWQFIRDNKFYALDLYMSPERVDYMQRLNIEMGTQRRILPYEQVTDLSLAADAVRMIEPSAR
jgi:ABC-type nitrate/sulfonate/bicarbonate transport system substrate-binding protein